MRENREKERENLLVLNMIVTQQKLCKWIWCRCKCKCIIKLSSMCWLGLFSRKVCVRLLNLNWTGSLSIVWFVNN